MKYPNNEFSLEEASWAVNLSRGHTTLDADIGTRGRDGLTCEGRVGFGGCGQSRLKNTWPSHQNPMRSSSLERKGRGPRAFRRPPHTYRQYHDKCRRILAPLLSQPEEDTQLASLQSITRWNTGAHQREQQDTGTMFVLCHLHLCPYATSLCFFSPLLPVPTSPSPLETLKPMSSCQNPRDWK